MKKILGFILVFFVLFSLSCKKEEYSKIKVILPSGTPLMAVGGLLDEKDEYDFEVVSGADLLVNALLNDEYDVVIAPVTACAKLNIAGKTQYKFAAVITTGNNYLVSRTETGTLENVNGKKIMAYGQNNTPDIILKAALDKVGLSADISYQASVNDVTPFITGSDNTYQYILTAEPTLTMLKTKFDLDLNVIDLQASLKSEIDMIPQAGIFVKVNETNKKSIDHFLKGVEENINYMNKHSDKYYDLVHSYNEFFEKLGENVLENSIPNSNIKYYNAKNNISTLEKYYDMLNKYNSNLLNGKSPNENFYY